jgi:polyphosphate kinase
MPRNFFNRVELVVPILDPRLRSHIISGILPNELADSSETWQMQPNGSYIPTASQKNGSTAQTEFLKMYP